MSEFQQGMILRNVLLDALCKSIQSIQESDK